MLAKPVHIDEANFLALTSGDWRQPHNIDINWQGQSQRAFDVLSNPPGIAWWLWPVRNQATWVMRLWMMPWVFGAVWGAIQLGKTINNSLWPAVLLVVSPIFVLSIGGLMPDMPLLACLLIGWGGFLKRRQPLFLLVLGCAVLFRYSALFFCLIFLISDVLKNKVDFTILSRTMLIFTPISVLFAFDLYSYGQIHFVHMIGFQTAHISLLDRFLQAPALLSMLAGGSGLLFFPRLLDSKGPLLCGVLVATVVVYFVPMSIGAGLWNGFWIAVGLAGFVGVLHRSTPQSRMWSFWLVLGFFFLMGLRFSATRYWMPFYFIYLMLFVNQTPLAKLKQGTAISIIISAFLFIDDFQFARSHYLGVQWANSKELKGAIAGHWGFQYYAETSGWISSEDDQPLPQNIEFLLRSSVAWPQEPIIECVNVIDSRTFPVLTAYLPHVHQPSMHANYHASAIYGQPPVRSFAPFGFGSDPYDELTLYQRCDSL